MPDYSKSKVYRIDNCIDDKFYIGCTTKSLAERMSKHRYNASSGRSTASLHQHMRDLGIHNFTIYLIECKPCTSKEELTALEGEHVRTLKPHLNYQTPGRSQMDYYNENREIVREKVKEYYKHNRETLIKKSKEYYEMNADNVSKVNKSRYEKNKVNVVCECGTQVLEHNLKRHTTSQLHLQLMDQLTSRMAS